MPTVYIMSGLPFSGKSTLSKVISEHLNIPRISFDETWIEIEKKGTIPGKDNVEKWKYICNVCEQKTREYLKDGISVVYDNLGSTYEQRQIIRDIAEETNAESRVVYVDTTKEEVISRRERNLSLKERAQVSDENFDNALKNFEIPTSKEQPYIYHPEQDMETWIDQELIQISKRERE